MVRVIFEPDQVSNVRLIDVAKVAVAKISTVSATALIRLYRDKG